ncbi:MAG: cytochrome P450 [bacterium]|nr:cytochrome P450 [bacterium]MDE0288214.1 cytochrome P450 [bacterium]MDE0439978.1 cytochrome P450 [bacterium]
MTVVLDAYDPEFLHDPYPAFDRIREETPVFRAPGRKGERPVWFLTRHADVRRALRDRRLGRIDQPTVDRIAWGLPPLRDELSRYYDVEHWALVWLEPPNHTKIRRLVSSAFTLRRVASLKPRITVLADRLLDPILERGRMDLVNDYAAPFSVQVIAELLGVPTNHWRQMLDWSSRITRMYEYNTDNAQTRSAVDACIEFSEYCEELMARRRAEPRDDLITALCFAETDEGTLTDIQIVSMIITLLNAGHEASVNTLANGMLALMQHPDQWRLLTGSEVSPATAVEELFRWDAPIQTFDRWVVAERYEVGGQSIGRYEQVTVLLGCANRDPRHFDDPNSFRIGRGDPTHVSFGGGIHHCLGAPLARLEVEVALERLVERLPRLQLARDPVRPPRFVLRGFNSLELALI